MPTDRPRTGTSDATSDAARVWLVERTCSDDEQNLIVLTYATPDGRHDFRKERGLTSFSGDQRGTPASLEVDRHNLGDVDDPETRARYRDEVERVRERYAPDEPI